MSPQTTAKRDPVATFIKILNLTSYILNKTAFLLLACVVAVSGCGSHAEKDPVKAANAFFSLLVSGSTKIAYNDHASFAYRAREDYPTFEARVRDMALEYATIEWTHQETEPGEVRLDGTLSTRHGQSAVALSLLREDGAWKIYTLRVGKEDSDTADEKVSVLAKNGDFNSVTNRKMPSPAAQQALLHESLLKFNEAIQQKSFADFYKYVALSWQEQITEKRLDDAFKSFIENGVDLSNVRKVDAIFLTQPLITSEGLLVLDGYYPLPPYKLLFQAQYAYEYPKWKLFGLKIDISK